MTRLRLTALVPWIAFALVMQVTSSAQAGMIYLNGVVLGSASPTNGTNIIEFGESDSFATPNPDATINGLTADPILLSTGNNSFTIGGRAASSTGIGLYFSTTPVLLNGATSGSPDFGRAPDLWAYFTNAGFALSPAGVSVATIGQSSGTSIYSGAQTFTIDNQLIAVTGWTGSSLSLEVTALPTNVTAVPEPSLLALLGLSFPVIASYTKKRRQQADSKP